MVAAMNDSPGSARADGSASLPRADRSAAVRHAHRAAGQTAALATMIVGERPFGEVAQQILAVRGSLDALLLRLVEMELDGCVPESDRAEVADLLGTALGRRSSARVVARTPPP